MYTSMIPMLKRAYEKGYAVMAINCFNLETVRSVIRAAESEKAPIIINIYEEHLLNHCDSELMAPLVQTLANRASVEVALNFDHGRNPIDVKKAIDSGFSSVMMDASLYPIEENCRITQEIVRYAHEKGVSVEGEIGALGAVEGDNMTREDMMTDPSQAQLFVDKTGVDALAVSFGSSHGNYPEGVYPVFDFQRLKAIKDCIDIPLVLHGGSGSGPDNIRRAVECGINKINVGCDYMNANRKATAEQMRRNPQINYYELIHAVERESMPIIRDYIQQSGSQKQSIVIPKEAFIC